MKKDQKGKKKFSYKRFAKRTAYVLFTLSILFFFAFKYTINSLKESGIQYSELHYSFPLTLEIDQFTINQDDFQLILKKIKLDLSIIDLFSGELAGETFLAKDLYIIYTFEDEEEPDEEPFNYDFMPFLSFEDVRIENTIVRTIDSTDFSIFTFPTVTASKFIWNDSIYAETVDYSKGTIAFLQPFTSDSTDTSQTKIEVIPNVPFFFVDEFNADSLEFIITGEESIFKINAIDFSVNGWNNIPGVDLNISHFYFTYQDTLAVKIDSSQFLLETDQSLAVQDLYINLPGIELNLKEFSIENIDSAYQYHINLEESHFSPRYAKYFNAEDVINSKAPPISVEIDAFYFQDTLKINEFICSLANNSSVDIDGYIFQPKELGAVNLTLTELNATEEDLKVYFDIDAPENMPPLNITSQLNFQGNKDHLNIKGDASIDQLQTRLDLAINNLLDEKMDADIQVYSPYVSSAMFEKETENPTKAYGLDLSTHINQFDLETLQNIEVKIEVDSVKNDDYQYYQIDLLAKYKNKITSILMESEEDNWNISLETKDNILDWDTLHFSGATAINTQNLSQFDVQQGEIESDFNGQFFFTDDVIFFNLDLDSLLFQTDDHSYIDNLQLTYLNEVDKYSVKVKDSSNLGLLFEFNQPFLDWMKMDEKSSSEIPDFDLDLSLNIDSSFIHDFFGVNADAKIEAVQIQAKDQNVNGIIDISYLRMDENYIKQLDGEIKMNEFNHHNKIQIDTLSTSFIYLNDIASIITFGEEMSDFNFETLAFFPRIEDSLGVNTTLVIDPDFYLFQFDSLKPQRAGETYWYSNNGDEIKVRTKDFSTIGELTFTSGIQSIHTQFTEKNVDLTIDSLNLGDILYYYIPSDSIQSSLNMTVNYAYSNSAINGESTIDKIVIDTINVGNIALDIKYENNQQNANLLYKHEIGFLDVKTYDLYNNPSFIGEIEDVDLNAVLQLVNLDTLELDTKGTLTGRFKGDYTDSLIVQGYVQFDSTEFNSPMYGFKSSINNQRLIVDQNKLKLHNFTILDQNKQPLKIDGYMDILHPEIINIDLKTDHFTLLNNKKQKGALKGKFDIKSQLHFSSKEDKLLISGFVNTLDGNNIEYFYESKVQLEDRSKTVSFISFGDTTDRIEVKRKKLKIDYDVDLNIGNTEIYVLLSKTSNEYFRLTCFGEISLEDGLLMTPNAYGELKSIDGHVYYEVPMVSNVQLNVQKARINWNGDLFDPIVNFKGEEVFRIFPNDVSPDLTSDGERVPVFVDVEVKNGTLDEIQLLFNISSDDGQVQNYLSSLTDNTRSDYAVSMLVYGKINQDAQKTKTGYESIVNKLNELSRRNLKNTDLSFRIEQYKNNPSAKKENYNKIGVDLSRNFLKDNLRVSAGGSLDINNEQNTDSPLSGYAKVMYQLRKKPDVYIMTSHTNNYEGQLVGRIDQSSLGFEINFEFDNLFKRKNKKDAE